MARQLSFGMLAGLAGSQIANRAVSTLEHTERLEAAAHAIGDVIANWLQDNERPSAARELRAVLRQRTRPAAELYREKHK